MTGFQTGLASAEDLHLEVFRQIIPGPSDVVGPDVGVETEVVEVSA